MSSENFFRLLKGRVTVESNLNTLLILRERKWENTGPIEYTETWVLGDLSPFQRAVY